MTMRTDTLEDLTRMRVAKQLRTRREKMGLSQRQISELVGCHAVSISQIENGRRNVCLNTLIRLALALGCTIRVSLDPLNGKRKRAG